MVRKQFLACDICGKGDARSVTIITGQTAWRIDVCNEHMAPVQELLVNAREARMPATKPGAYEKVSLEHLLAIAKGGESDDD